MYPEVDLEGDDRGMVVSLVLGSLPCPRGRPTLEFGERFMIHGLRVNLKHVVIRLHRHTLPLRRPSGTLRALVEDQVTYTPAPTCKPGRPFPLRMAPYHSRRRTTFRTVEANHRPPRLVGTPSAFRAPAIPA